MKKFVTFFLILSIGMLVSGCTTPQPQIKCGDGYCDTDAGEGPHNCAKDCRGIAKACGDGYCVTEAGEDCSSCPKDCGECPKPDGGESHFGVHLGSFGYGSAKPHIEELGSHIFVRTEFFGDAFGWKKVKGNKASIDLCHSCCDSGISSCDCKPDDTYYCSPDSRNSLLKTPVLMDFYDNDFNQLVTVCASRYDELPPKELTPDYPHGKEDVYRDYISFLVENFGHKVKYWEVGNENEAPFFWKGTPKEYADLVRLTSEEIRSKCADCKVGISFAHPSVAVKLGGNDEWFIQMGRVCDSFDFIDAHYYSPTFIDSGELDRWKETCPGKEFISTETGVLDIPNDERKPQAGGSIEKQAKDLAKYNTLLFAEGYDKIYMFLVDTDYGMGYYFLHNGLINETDHSRKPAFTSYKTMIEKVDNFVSIEKLAVGQYKYSFRDKAPVYVLWCDYGSCPIPSEISGTVTVTDYLGREEFKQASEIVLNDSPVFIEKV